MMPLETATPAHPRWSSRIIREIAEVRAERLWDISDEDAIAEGIDWTPLGKVYDRVLSEAEMKEIYEYERPRGAYSRLWESINGTKYPWEGNWWVWPISFRLLDTK